MLLERIRKREKSWLHNASYNAASYGGAFLRRRNGVPTPLLCSCASQRGHCGSLALGASTHAATRFCYRSLLCLLRESTLGPYVCFGDCVWHFQLYSALVRHPLVLQGFLVFRYRDDVCRVRCKGGLVHLC